MIRVRVVDADEIPVRVMTERPVVVETGASQVSLYDKYTGTTTVTPTEQTQTLLTRGQVLDDDVTILPIPENYSDVTVPLAWMGPGAEHVDRFCDYFYTLGETAYNGWTPSTTAKAIIAAKSLAARPIDMANYEYLIRWRVNVDAAFLTGATKKVQFEKYSASLWQSVHRRPYGFSNFEAENYAYNYCTTMYSGTSYTVYYKPDGTRTWTTGISYGIYAALSSMALSSTASDTPNLTIKTPVINARCSTTYFATARAAELDQDNTVITIRGDLYRVPIGYSSLRHAYGDAIKVFNNGINADG